MTILSLFRLTTVVLRGARRLAERLKAHIAIIDKRRPRPNVAEGMNIIQNAEGKTTMLIDDIIDTAGTITLAANALTESGAKEVYACFAPLDSLLDQLLSELRTRT